MPKRLKVTKTDAGKITAYAILFQVNEGFEQILARLQELGHSGEWRQVSKRLQLIVEETRAEVNFELVEFLQERELRDWTRLGIARQRATTSFKAGQKVNLNSWPESLGFARARLPASRCRRLGSGRAQELLKRCDGSFRGRLLNPHLPHELLEFHFLTAVFRSPTWFHNKLLAGFQPRQQFR